MKKIDILGTEYTIEYKSIKSDEKLEEMEGYIDFYKKTIILANIEEREYYKNEPKEKIDEVKAKVLRHEIVHGFLYESGLDCNSNKTYSWADNEEMVDWFAIQSPKIIKVFQELEIYKGYNSKQIEFLKDTVLNLLIQNEKLNKDELSTYQIVMEKSLLNISDMFELGIKKG